MKKIENVHQILISDLEDVTPFVPIVTTSIKKYFNPKKYKYILWTKEDIRNFITNNFDNEVLAAYDKLKPYAYKADLARYCIVYVLGGWYVDINIKMIAIPPITDSFDMCLIRDYNNGTRVAPWQLANGFFYAKPKHPALLNAINMVVQHTKDLFYGKRTLSVTGPELFGSAVAAIGWDSNHNTNYLVGDFVNNFDLNRKQFVFNNKVIALHKQSLGGEVGIKGTNNYVEMWHNRDIYNR
jgi:mannosyltransferase OCH1-like enzyme